MYLRSQPVAVAHFWMLYAIAAVSFLPALGFHYVGEEAIFPISSLEMWYHGKWVEQLFYGASLQHNPLFNWMIIPLASLVGWEHMLAVTRALTIAATVGTGLVVAWLCRGLYRDSAFALFAALVYVTLADIFFYRGWLAYVDPLFAFFLTSATACLWIACLRQSAGLLALAVAALTCAFMTKALTAYAFYGGAALVLLLVERRHRAFLLRPVSWAVHGGGAAAALAWLYFLPQNSGQGGRMFAEIFAKLAPVDLGDHLLKLVVYPLDTLLHLGPLALVAAYFLWKRRGTGEYDPHVRTALAIALVNYLPYWLAPQSSIRYLLPLYPLAAFAIARWLWTLGGTAAARRWIISLMAVKLVFVLAAFPYYQSHYRGENFETAARDIAWRTAGQPLYANNVSASGMSVTAHLDIQRLPAPPLTFAPPQWETGFVMAYALDPELGKVAGEYRLGGNTLYLLCRGSACAR